MISPPDLPEPIATAHRRMELGFQRLTDNEATRLLECATAEFHRAQRLEQEVLDAAAARRRDAEFDRQNLEHIARLESLLGGVLVVAGFIVTVLLIALWSLS